MLLMVVYQGRSGFAGARRWAFLRSTGLSIALGAMVWLSSGASVPALAQRADGEPLVLSFSDVWAYAEQLFHEREYYRAVSEYKRLLHFFPSTSYAEVARIRIGEAHLLGGEPERAAEQFSDLLRMPEMAPVQTELYLLRALARLEWDVEVPYRLRVSHVESALADLRAIPSDWPGAPATREFVQSIENPEDLPEKSPWLAGSLSAVLPGLGSAYVGNYSEAALAFFVNALFIGATIQAHEHNDDDAAIVLGVAALAFYGGSIYSAANGAHRYNDRARTEHLKAQRVRFGLVLRPEGIAAALKGRF